jgi:hypothetical protein
MVGCTCLWYRLITGCLVQVGAWLMHLFMVQVDAWLMHGSGLLVHVYSGISHSDSVTTQTQRRSYNMFESLNIEVECYKCNIF